MGSLPFQSLPVSLSRRIQCLPIAPVGTSGRRLVRRLALSAKLQRPDASPSKNPPLCAPPDHNVLRPSTVKIPFGGKPLHESIPLTKPTDSIRTVQRGKRIHQLYRAIEAGDEVTALEIYRKMKKGPTIRQLRVSDFSLLIRSILPVNHLSLTSLHWLTPKGDPVRTPHDQASARLQSTIMNVVRFMTKIGHRLNSADFLHLLRCACAARLPDMADEIWAWIKRDGVSIDAEHYNFYIGAHCGTTHTEHWGKSDGRAIKRRLESGHDPRAKALRGIDQMSRNGIAPNSKTYELLIVAMGRMGDVRGIYDALDRIWRVNINNVDESRLALDKQSPLYPTEDTLLAVAYALGATGEVKNAIVAVDLMATRYVNPINMPTWYTLLNFTYAYSAGWARNRYIKPAAVERLWEVMTSPQYNVQPTFSFYDYIVRSYLQRMMYVKAEKMMDGALEEYSKIARKHKELSSSLKSMRQTSIREGRDPNKQLVANLKAKHAYLRMSLLRGAYQVRRWAELLTLGKGMEKLHDMARRRIPDMVEKWGPFLDRNVVYYIEDGYVVLDRGPDIQGPRWMPGARRKPNREGLGLGYMSKETDDF